MKGIEVRGIPEKKTCLKDLLSNCTDFIDEETLLQKTVRELGAVLDRSPL